MVLQDPAGEISRSEFGAIRATGSPGLCRRYRTAASAVTPGAVVNVSCGDLSSVGVHHEDVLVHTRFGTTTSEVDVPLIPRPAGRPTAPPLARTSSGLEEDSLDCFRRCPSQRLRGRIENNNVVGSYRTGPRNQRRAPTILNNVFFPALMWNSRFNSVSGNPFDNSAGFQFPLPEGFSLSGLPHLLTAQAFIPTTEKPETQLR